MSLNDGQSSYGNLTSIGESPVNGQVVYTGSDDGRVQITQDAGNTWTDLTDNIEGLPDNVYVTRIVASHTDEGTVYIAFDNHRSDDFAPYLFVSTDFGREWRAAVSGLPQSSLNALAQHPRNPKPDVRWKRNRSIRIGQFRRPVGSARKWTPDCTGG